MVKSSKLRPNLKMNRNKSRNKTRTRNKTRIRNKRLNRKSRQKGGNPIMIKKLCSSSKRGGSIKEKDSVSAAYIEELCNNQTQEGGSSGGMFSGIMSKMFSAATLPITLATGTFKKVSGVDLGELVKNNVSRALNKTELAGTGSNVTSSLAKESSDRDTDTELKTFLSKRNM